MPTNHSTPNHFAIGAALAGLPLLVLSVIALVLGFLSGVTLAMPDLGALTMPDVPGVVWTGVGLLIVGVLVGCFYTHDRAWGAVAVVPLIVLAVFLLALAASGTVEGIPGASNPEVRAGAQYVVSAVFGAADDSSDSFQAGGRRVFTNMSK